MSATKQNKVTPPPATANEPAPTQRKRRPWRDFVETLKLARKHNASMLAGSLAFFCLFALFPYLILSLNITLYLLGETDSAASALKIRQILEAFLPSMSVLVTDNVLGLLAQNPLTNFLNTALLCWSSYELFSVLETIFAQLSVDGEDRDGWLAHVGATVCFLIAASTTILSVLISAADVGLVQSLFHLEGRQVDVRVLRSLALLTSIGSLFLGLTAIFKLMPTRQISFLHATKASVVFLGLFLVGRLGYQIYEVYYRTVNTSFYGSLLPFLVIVVWLYYLSAAFLFAAQYAIYLSSRKPTPPVKAATP